jgi:hypothetical protein
MFFSIERHILRIIDYNSCFTRQCRSVFLYLGIYDAFIIEIEIKENIKQ